MFGDPTPTVPRGLRIDPWAISQLDTVLAQFKPPTDTAWLKTESSRRRLTLRPTWLAVASAGIVGTISGALIAVLSGPVVF